MISYLMFAKFHLNDFMMLELEVGIRASPTLMGHGPLGLNFLWANVWSARP